MRGVLIEAHSVTGLARIVGKSRDTILRYEEKGIFPPAPIMFGVVRYYPDDLCKELIPLVKKIPTNKVISAKLIAEIHKLFKTQKEKLCQRQNEVQTM